MSDARTMPQNYSRGLRESGEQPAYFFAGLQLPLAKICNSAKRDTSPMTEGDYCSEKLAESNE